MPNADGKIVLTSDGRRIITSDGKLACDCCCACPEDAASAYTLDFRFRYRDQTDCSVFIIDCSHIVTLNRVYDGDTPTCVWAPDEQPLCNRYEEGTGGVGVGTINLTFGLTIALSLVTVDGECKWEVRVTGSVQPGLDPATYLAFASGPVGVYPDIVGNDGVNCAPDYWRFEAEIS